MTALVLHNSILAQPLRTAFDSIARENNIMGGALVLFCEKEITDSLYYGKADNERNIDVSCRTAFRVASISKMVTAVAIMQLVENKRLNLDTDIGQLLGYDIIHPKYSGTPITCRMLLSHTSSLLDGDGYDHFLQATVGEDTVPHLRTLLTSSGKFYSSALFGDKIPGTFFTYANINYVVLGTIVEKISGLRFDRYCTKNILLPLGLQASFNVCDLKDINQLAVLYRKADGKWMPQADSFRGVQPVYANVKRYVPGTNAARFAPQGGLRCTATDLARLMMFIMQGHPHKKILSSQSLSAMRTAQWKYDGSNGDDYNGLFRCWGLGLHIITGTPGKDIIFSETAIMFGHSGDAYGLISDAYVDPVRKAGFVFITNGTGRGYSTSDRSAFFTIEKQIFEAIDKSGGMGKCGKQK